MVIINCEINKLSLELYSFTREYYLSSVAQLYSSNLITELFNFTYRSIRIDIKTIHCILLQIFRSICPHRKICDYDIQGCRWQTTCYVYRYHFRYWPFNFRLHC